MTILGTVDLAALDLGGLSFGDRMALGKVLNGRPEKVRGRWTLKGVQDNVRLDHPSVLRVLGGPLDAEHGSTRYEPDADQTRKLEADFDAYHAELDVPPACVPAQFARIGGPAVTAWLAVLSSEAMLDYALAVCNEYSGGPLAVPPESMAQTTVMGIRGRLRMLAIEDSQRR